MGAFFAASTIEPRLSPQPGKQVLYESNGKGMKIEARSAFLRVYVVSVFAPLPWLGGTLAVTQEDR